MMFNSGILSLILLPLLCISLIRSQDPADREKRALSRTSQSFQCESEGFFSDPNDCSVFYRCIDWGRESSDNSVQTRYTSFKFQCRSGAVYDPETNSCILSDLSTNPKCHSQSSEPLHINFPRASALQSDPNNLDYGVVQPQQEYQQHAQQQPTYMKPLGTDAQIEPMNEVDNTIHEQPPRVTRSPPCTSEGFFPIEGDCSHFYRCVGSGSGFIKYDFACGEGTVWDPDNNACNHAWAVTRTDCKLDQSGNNANPEGEGSEYNPNVDGIPGQEGGYPGPDSYPNQGGYPGQGSGSGYPNQGSGSGYPNQGSGSGYPSQGSGSGYPGGSTAEPEQNLPSSSQPSQGYPSSSIQPTGKPTLESTTLANKPSGSPGNQSITNSNGTCSSEGFQGVSGNCRKFIRCVRNSGGFTKYEFECAEETVWDTDAQTCNYANAVQRSDCKNETSSQVSPTAGGPNNSNTDSGTSTNEKPTTSSQPSYGGSNQQPSSTSGQTSNQTSTPGQAPSSSQTTPPQQQTTSLSEATPSNPEGNQSSTQPSSSNGNNTNPSAPNKVDQCTEEGFFPSSTDCNKFYRCVKNEGKGFSKYEFNCGPGTVYDPNNNVCNHPSAVQNNKCKGEGGEQIQGSTNPMPEETTQSPTGSSTTPASTSSASTKKPTQSSSTTVKPGSSTTSVKPSKNTTTTAKPSVSTSQKPSNVTTPKPNQSTTVKPNKNTTTTTKPSSSKPVVSTSPSSNKNTTQTSKPSTSSTTPPSTTSDPASENSTNTESTMPSQNNTETQKPTTLGNSTLETTTNVANCDKNNTKPEASVKVNCTKAGFYPYPGNCKKFYRCVDWDGDKGERFSVYYFDCPEGTIYDPSLETCNHAESVYPPRDCESNPESQVSTDSTPNNSTNPEEITNTTPSENGTTNATDGSTEPTTTMPDSSSTNANNETTIPSTDATTISPNEITTQSSSTNAGTTEPSSGTTNATPAGTTQNPEENTTPTNQITTINPQESTTLPSQENDNKTCPELEPDQFAIVCPTGFRRHPKFCNLFYQCTTSPSNEIKVLTLSCSNGTIYDEDKIQCLPPDQARKCDGMISDSRNLRLIPENGIAPVPVKSDKSICPNEGSYTYKEDCRLFYKCKKNGEGKINGFIYQCPEGYAYWNISKRCEDVRKVPCDSGRKLFGKPTLAPVENRNIGQK